MVLKPLEYFFLHTYHRNVLFRHKHDMRPKYLVLCLRPFKHASDKAKALSTSSLHIIEYSQGRKMIVISMNIKTQYVVILIIQYNKTLESPKNLHMRTFFTSTYIIEKDCIVCLFLLSKQHYIINLRKVGSLEKEMLKSTYCGRNSSFLLLLLRLNVHKSVT